MKTKQLLLSLFCAALLGGCASAPPVAPPAPPPPPPRTMASFLEQSSNAIKVGKFEEAVAVLKQAAKIYPAEKTAWLRIAQVNFECQEYGEAITYAKKVIERDPDDMVAHSIAAVSGLRVSSKALADLTTKRKISSDVRTEAQSLATILRTSIGGDIIVPIKEKKPMQRVIVPAPKVATEIPFGTPN